MKTSIKWLKQYVDIPWDAEELADKLTLAGLEVEGVERIGAIPDGVVIAEILARDLHPNADKLSVCRVSVGGEVPLQIVCGAPNCEPGRKVPLATVGTVLGEGFKIKRAKLRGELSEGMLCAEDELGLGSDHAGLMELPADAPVGTALADYLGSDTVIDWEVTPNRPDWLSHFGIAREIAAVADCGGTLKRPAADLKAAPGTDVAAVAKVEVQDPDLCPRYIARVIRNVRIGPSPDWMQQALRAVGMRPINNVVDITNYVLMECGQPLHAFDCDLLAQRTIVVRRARPGEKLTTLDEEEHDLSEDNLLIADAERGVALAGVMGGANSEISEKTTTVLLESAAFNPANIRATAKSLGIATEASHRFERGIDIEGVEYASRRATALICEYAGGELLDGVLDVYAAPFAPSRVSCRTQRTRDLLGIEIDSETVAKLLARLGLDVVAVDDEAVAVSVPSFRGDLVREVDLIEEVARLYGLDNIPGEPERARVGGSMRTDRFYPLEEVRSELLALGLDETMTYSTISAEAAVAGTDVAVEQLVVLANPLNRDASVMRPSLLPGLLQTAAHNIAHNNLQLAFFEFGRVLVNAPGISEERYQVGIVLSGLRHPGRFGAERQEELDLFDIKGLIESWLRARRIAAWDCIPAQHAAFREGACAALVIDGTRIAVFGELAGELTSDLRLKHSVFAALVEVEALFGVTVPARVYEPLPQFPSVVRDVSLVADSQVRNQAVVDAMRAADCPWLESVELFDVYEDEKALGAGRRSLAYSLVYRDSARTLTDEEVNAAHEKVRRGLAATHGIELR